MLETDCSEGQEDLGWLHEDIGEEWNCPLNPGGV